MTDTTTTSSTPSELDLAFIIDATGSMGSYIHSAQQNMKAIIHDIITSEKCLLNVALILYRDHPPQDTSFVIKVHDFTDDAEEAKTNIDGASASGGGDGPEAIAPALHAAAHTLSWRKNAVKIALLIADAPPHGLEKVGDGFPDGDPSGHDPVECVNALAEQSVTLYAIGCEPAALTYRDFFMALAFKTGGQYVPLANSANLASIIVGSAREEISLERLLAQVHEEVMQEAASRGGPVDETELTRRIHEVMQGGGARARRVKMNNTDGTNDIPALTPAAEELSKLTTLNEVQQKWVRNNATFAFTPTPFGGLFGGGGVGRKILKAARTTRKKTTVTTSKAAPKPKPAVPMKKTSAKRKASPSVKPMIKKKARPAPVRGSRRSARLALSSDPKTDESSDTESMEATPAPAPAVAPVAAPSTASTTKKPASMKTKMSEVNLADDELLDITQTRRLVRKCIARNKLKTT